MELFGSSLVDMMERDMKDSMYDSVYYPSLGSSPLFPDLVWPTGPLDSSLDQLDPGIMVDPAAVVPRRHTEQQHQARPLSSSAKDEFILPDILSHSKLRVEVDESSEEEEDGDDEVEEDVKISVKKTIQLSSMPRHHSEHHLDSEHQQMSENKRKLQQQQHQWTMLVNKKVGQKGLSSGIIKVKREQVRSPSLTRSPSTQIARSPSTHITRSPSVVRSPTVARSPVARSPSVADSPPSAYGKTYHQAEYPKPAYSYSCLIAMALKNSPSGSLPVSEIYNFMCEHFPYFKTAPSGWKNSVRHNLSLNKCFEKIEKTTHGGSRKGCLWALNPVRMAKMDEEVAKWRKKDPEAIKQAMARPETLDRLERGEMKIKLRVIKEEEDEEEDEEEQEEVVQPHIASGHIILEEPEEEEEQEPEQEEEQVTEESEQSQDDQSDEEGEIPPSLKPFDRQLNSRLNPSLEQTDIGVEFSEEVYEELGLLEEVLEEEAVYNVPAKRSRLDHRHSGATTQSYHRHAIASLQ